MRPPGQEDFDRLRSLSYAETHVIIICFSVRRGCVSHRVCANHSLYPRLQIDNPVSLENVEGKVQPLFFSTIAPCLTVILRVVDGRNPRGMQCQPAFSTLLP